MIALLKNLIEYWNKATSNNLHNYIASIFLALSMLVSLSILIMSIVAWVRGTTQPPKEIFTLLEMELYFLGLVAGLNGGFHTVKAIKGAKGANTPEEPHPSARADGDEKT